MASSHCDLRHQNYIQDEDMESMNEAISHLNEKIEIIMSWKEQSFREEDSKENEEKEEVKTKMKTEGDDSQKEKLMYPHSSNDRSVPSVPSFPSGDYERRSDRTTMTTSRGNKIENNKFLEQEYTFRKLSLQTISSDKHESLTPLNDNIEAENYARTKCSLIKENNLNFYEPGDVETMFKLSLDLMTDAYSHDISWALFSSHNRNESIIDSILEKSTPSNSLLPNSLHKFEYECYVSVVENTNQSETFESKKEICYDFDMYDSSMFVSGFCCEYGLGYFTVNINEKVAISYRLYGNALTTSFCVDSNGEVIKTEKEIEKEKEKTQASIYPSRDCIGDRCICDSNPALTRFEEGDNDDMYQIKMNVLVNMMILSGSEKLMDVSTPQYKAACWTLNDDSFSVQQLESTSMSSRRIEQRMIQRYILALFYFATNGQNWLNHYNFLSSRSECQWNKVDEPNNINVGFIGGSVCDENERVMYIGFVQNNLNGIMIDELYGLKSLEQLVLSEEKDLHGTIPSNLGRLSHLRSLLILDTSVEGAIPSQLFGATKMQRLSFFQNNLSGTIPESIGNLQVLSNLNLALNSLSGSLPQHVYDLKNLVKLQFRANKFTGTISLSIQNLGELELFDVGTNKFSGAIPSSMKHLRQLKDLYIDKFLRDYSKLFVIFSKPCFTGSVTDQFCDMNMDTGVTADCKNDIFHPQVSCSCCFYCVDETPTWSGEECPDTKISVHIDHKVHSERLSERNSDGLIWELKDSSSEKSKLRKGPFEFGLDNGLSYEACVANSQCFSLVMLAAPMEDTNYTISWNEEPVYDGTFAGRTLNEDFNVSDPAQTMISFQYDERKEIVKFDNSATCRNLQLVCYHGSILDLEANTTQRILYDATVKISGQTMLQDPSSPQSDALCWILSNETMQFSSSLKEFTQRYILTLLHLTSKNGLFGKDKYPPLTHECEWQSIECSNSSKMVTSLSLLSSIGQIINGTLIHEIGSLEYLEKLELKQTELSGTIPQSLSNLWRLKKLDLSQNSISGVIPETLFRQLDKLEHIDLSNNFLLGGNIPYDMGKYSPLRTVLLNNNQLQGSLPLKDFKYDDLEIFDVHENLLDGIDLSFLSKHTKLKKLDLSSNFVVGTLHDEVLETFEELEYFNISQNEFSGALPSKSHLPSKVTHFDVHINKIKGTIHDSISKLSNLEYLNLQGNQLTGSIPNEMNQLEKLNTLVLSLSSIPLESNKLPNIQTLHLHRNPLVGKAPSFLKMISYITDCGFPSDHTDPVTCPTCNKCCNSNDRCRVTKVNQNTVIKTAAFSFTLIGFLLLCYSWKEKIATHKCCERFFSNSVSNWNALGIINDRSVYHFLLTKNKVGWRVGLLTGIFQISTLFLFVVEASSYSLKCPSYSLECEDTEPGINASPWGLVIFGLILMIWLTRDLVSSIKLLLLALQKKSIDIMFTGGFVFFITMLAAWTSIYYNLATVTTDNELIVNTVVLLFVLEADERLYQLAAYCDPGFVRDVEDFIEQNKITGGEYDENKLYFSSWINRLRGKKQKKDKKDDKKEVQLGGEDERKTPI